MRKLFKSALLLAAFARASIIFALRRRPLLAEMKGRTAIPSMLFLSFLLSLSGRAQDSNIVACYAPLPMQELKASNLGKFLMALSAAWNSLDPKAQSGFSGLVDKAVAGQAFSPASAVYMKLAYSEHVEQMARRSQMLTCYKGALPGSSPYIERKSAESIEAQLQAIAEAKAKGVLNQASADLAAKAIAKELETLRLLWLLNGKDGDAKPVAVSSMAVDAAKAMIDMHLATPDPSLKDKNANKAKACPK